MYYIVNADVSNIEYSMSYAIFSIEKNREDAKKYILNYNANAKDFISKNEDLLKTASIDPYDTKEYYDYCRQWEKNQNLPLPDSVTNLVNKQCNALKTLNNILLEKGLIKEDTDNGVFKVFTFKIECEDDFNVYIDVLDKCPFIACSYSE